MHITLLNLALYQQQCQVMYCNMLHARWAHRKLDMARAASLLLFRYDFTDGDLGVSLTQMRMFLDEYADIPFRVLRFLVTEINYGGRVTDDKDRRLINNLVTGFVGPQVLDPGYNFSASGATPILAVMHWWLRLHWYH